MAPNHASYLDPPILGISLKRRVTYLAKAYLFKHPLVGFVLRSIGAYPIKTESGNDFRSVRDLVRLLKQGHCVTVFPEGTRSETGEFREPESGIGFLAMKSGAWVVPVYIKGSYAAFPPAKGGSASGGNGAKLRFLPIEVHYGKAFIPAENKEWAAMEDPYTAVSQRIMQDIKGLKEKVEAKVLPM